ncbi:MFS transporter [Luteibacter anthropi]|uniref:MFS transporter n=1 Tax=Luteibacter anthropi TaxID=564369 RepID=A0A7X5UBT5_9GAMM|nr:MFS transporter [Luteibacter anthropi]NII07449.1 MFS transporter [Luteibacter anthropi]URX61188.1 MFS transporter [Luteibacter anthropi]
MSTPAIPASRRSLAIHSATLIAFLAASGAPTPLYRLYQAQWHFSPTLLTTIFAVYAFALLLTLLFAGRLSDHLGRRPVIALAIGLEMLSLLSFLLADGPAWLVVARLVQGIATGLATAAIGAAMLDIDREHGATVNSIAPLIGLAVGALGSTSLVVLAPSPLHTVFIVLGLLFAIGFVMTWTTPETSGGRPGALASLRPSVAVPPHARGALLAVTPLNVAVWMLGGFYLSLMPSLVAQTTHSTSPWLGGLTVSALTFTGSMAVLAAMRVTAYRALLSGASLLIVGLVMILVATRFGSGLWLVVGSIIGGGGFGASFLGSVRAVLPLAEASDRTRLMAVFYIESYLALSVPTIAIGCVAQHYGLLLAIDIYAAIILVLALAAVGWIVSRAHHVRAPSPMPVGG